MGRPLFSSDNAEMSRFGTAAATRNGTGAGQFRRLMTTFVLFFGVVSTLLLGACTELTYTATLDLGDDAAVAGVPQGYKYKVTASNGEDRTGEASIVKLGTQPSEGVTQEGNKLVFTQARTHVVTATIEIDGQTIEASAAIEVVAGAPDHVLVSANPPEPHAGQVVTIEPQVVDAWNNPTFPPGSFKVDVSPSTGVTLNSLTAIFTIADVYQVTATDLQHSWTGKVNVPVSMDTPLRARLEVSPDRLQPGQSTSVTFIGVDGYGNEGPIDGTYTTAPNTGVTVNEDSIRFSNEGLYEVTAQGEGFTARADVTVDGTIPELVLASPARATYQTENPVKFQGTLTDNLSGVASLTINGASVPVAGGKFSYDYPAAPGTNIIELQATDLNGNFTTLTQSFVWAPEWTPVGSPSSFGLVGRLNEASLTLITDLLEAELDPKELEADLLAENPIATYDDSGITATVEIVSFGYSAVEGVLKPHHDAGNGYIEIQITFRNLYARLRAYGEAWFDDYDVTGDLTATVGMAKGNASAVVKNGIPDVIIDSNAVDVSFSDFDVTFSGTVLNAIGEILESQIQDELEAELETYIVKEVPPFLEEYLTYLNYTVTSPVAVGELSTDLTISTELEGVLFDDVGMSVVETTRISAPAGAGMPENPGAPKVGASKLSYGATPGYLVSASFDALNSLVHTLWMSGILKYDYTVVADTGQSFAAAINLPLPPVVQPSLDPAFAIDATAGDIYLDLYLDPTGPPTYQLAVSLIVPATVESGSSGTVVSVKFGEPTVAYHVLAAPARGLDATALGAMVTELVAELLDEAETSLTDLALPEFEGYQLTINQVGTQGDGWGWLSVGGYLE